MKKESDVSEYDRNVAMLLLHNAKAEKVIEKYRNEVEGKKKAKE